MEVKRSNFVSAKVLTFHELRRSLSSLILGTLTSSTFLCLSIPLKLPAEGHGMVVPTTRTGWLIQPVYQIEKAHK